MDFPTQKLDILNASLEGELHYDAAMRTLYATDASVYREMPLAVAIPTGKEDLRQLIAFATTEKVSLIPRAAGTSLAGQCVGDGIVVDISQKMCGILEVNEQESWVRVQPGVVRDELNHHLKPHGLFFGPNTSTANRAMMGGMVGNNSCGSYSIVYGSTREHLLEVTAFLSDGSEVVFKSVSEAEFEEKCQLKGLEGEIYRQIDKMLADPANQEEIRKEFPNANIHRRNTGYALDFLLNSGRFTPEGEPFNFCKLIAGSEGTLCFITEIKVHCDPLPPTETALMCVHFSSVEESLKAVVVAMEHQPRACELVDKIVLDCTKENLLYRENRSFVKGDPAAILMIEFGGDELEQQLDQLETALKEGNLGNHYPRLRGDDSYKAWELRKAGLGLLANVPGDPKAVAVIEDTAVEVTKLPAYISEFTEMMESHGQKAVYYAHAGAGELHLRPILDLKKEEDRKLFRTIGHDTAKLVKKYGGSLSGEHGDGRVRAEFIPVVVGEKNYQLFQSVKKTWDPQNIFNPGKIVAPPPMDTSLRYESGQETAQFDTAMSFSETGGILRAAEKCNGSGDCRKLPLSGGTMCPSYMATRKEKDTTRARANILREFLTKSPQKNRFAHKEIYEVMDLCLSCKGCASECPSNVDIASMKAEFLHQYHKANGLPFRSRVFGNFATLNGLGARFPRLTNSVLAGNASSNMLKRILGVAPERSMPLLSRMTLRKWYKKAKRGLIVEGTPKGKVYLFCDEFTNLNDAHIGVKTIQLLYRLGYEVVMPEHPESGRAAISKGMLGKAQRLATQNLAIFGRRVTAETPLVGIEPSCILGFRDEYPRLVEERFVPAARVLGKNSLLIDEFLAKETEKGNISPDLFTREKKKVLLHGHCHQKALASIKPTISMLELPAHYEVSVIPSGCCGMAGSFGYEKEHYDISMQMGEMVLLPAVREAGEEVLIAAPGTSCRHQIFDGTGRKARHPVEILLDAMI